MAKLDFCVRCGCWISADTGTMRQGQDGQAEIICDDCLSIEQNGAEVEHDSRCRILNDE